MASRRGDTFDKRQRERRRQEKAADKRSRRQGTPSPNGPLVATQDKAPPKSNIDTLIEDFTPKTSAHRDLLEKFSMIKEHKKAGGIDNDTYELLRMEIFEDLGLEP
jgi:hypothetical protein